MISTQQQEQILQILAPYKPEKVAVFGSFARGEQNKNSDLDLLVKFNTRISLLQLVQLEQSISDSLNIKTELITESALKNPKLVKYIQKDLISIN
ncbi:MAG: nucleotidyltransferase domain-containing protein [Bacteroidetes bacterium]|nr:nucleotidyltransferase domain-containing protein [Bacteroidota bacterium]